MFYELLVPRLAGFDARSVGILHGLATVAQRCGRTPVIRPFGSLPLSLGKRIEGVVWGILVPRKIVCITSLMTLPSYQGNHWCLSELDPRRGD